MFIFVVYMINNDKYFTFKEYVITVAYISRMIITVLMGLCWMQYMGHWHRKVYRILLIFFHSIVSDSMQTLQCCSDPEETPPTPELQSVYQRFSAAFKKIRLANIYYHVSRHAIKNNLLTESRLSCDLHFCLSRFYCVIKSALIFTS